MMLRHDEWEFDFTFQENVTQWLVVEEPKVFRELICELKRQCQGESGGFVLSENSKLLSISSKMMLLTDPFSVEVNNRKAITSLHKSMASLAVDEEHYLNMQETVSHIFRFLEDLSAEYQHPISIDYETGIEKLFKAYDVGFETEDTTFPEVFLDFTNIMTDFCGISVFVFCNLSGCLTSTELLGLIAAWHGAKVPILLIDSVAPVVDIDMNRWIIDEDQCLIRG